MFVTRKAILCLLWFAVSAPFLMAAPSLPAETPVRSDAGATLAAAPPSTALMDPSVGDVGLQSKPEPVPQEAAASGRPAAGAEDTLPSAGSGESGTYLLARTFGGLGLVISLIILAYVAVRRYGPKYLRRQGAQGALKVIETLPIGEKRSISLIQVEDRRLLIGNTQQQITLLAQLPATIEAAIEPGREPLPRSTPGTVSSFRKLYEVEKSQSTLPQAKAIPQDLREKMRQLRDALEK
jgi:flagellar biosynthetic protein FliO